MQQVNIGMIGGGTVGSGVFHHLQRNGSLMASRLGVKVSLRRVAVKAFDEPRPYDIPRSYLTTDWKSVVADPKVHAIIELVGGTTLARTMMLAALQARQTGHHRQQGADFRPRRGTVCRCAKVRHEPLLRSQRVRRHSDHQIAARRFRRQPDHAHLRHRQRHLQLHPHPDEAGGRRFRRGAGRRATLGYAEAEPHLDIDGYDSEHKTGILASLAHGFWVKPKEIHVEGIRHISRLDMQYAQQLGYTIKLLGIVKQDGQKRVRRERIR